MKIILRDGRERVITGYWRIICGRNPVMKIYRDKQKKELIEEFPFKEIVNEQKQNLQQEW